MSELAKCPKCSSGELEKGYIHGLTTYWDAEKSDWNVFSGDKVGFTEKG